MSGLRFGGIAVYVSQGQKLLIRFVQSAYPSITGNNLPELDVFFSMASFFSLVFIAPFNADNVADKAGLIWLACK